MAFHLHRLGLVGRALREVGYNMHDVADLAAGRTSLKSTDTTEMAKRLGIAEQQLTRDLTEQENRIWAFYRRSAADPKYVWNSARVAWQAAEFSEQQAHRSWASTARTYGARPPIPTASFFHFTKPHASQLLSTFKKALKSSCHHQRATILSNHAECAHVSLSFTQILPPKLNRTEAPSTTVWGTHHL